MGDRISFPKAPRLSAPGRQGGQAVTLRLERSGPVGTIIINRPEKRNAFNQEMWDRFPVLLTHAMADRAIRVIVIRSSTNGMFCAGADIAELLAHKANPAWREANQAAIYKTQHELARAGKPTIAFIDGDCVGGGCGIALACDIRVATARARIGITPAKLGLVYPLHDIKLLIDLVGPGQAKKMLFSGELYSAVEALRINLIEEINEDVEMLALQIASNSSHSIHEMKILVRNILDGQVEEDASSKKRFADALTKPDFLEGCAAFVDRRKPDFI